MDIKSIKEFNADALKSYLWTVL